MLPGPRPPAPLSRVGAWPVDLRPTLGAESRDHAAALVETGVMTVEADALLTMFAAAGVPAGIVSVDGETITVSMPDGGWFTIIPHADEYGRCWRAYRYFGPDDLGWYSDHHSPGMVDQVRTGLYGRGDRRERDVDG